MTTFNYSAAAELFPGNSRYPARSFFRYRRFALASDAIRFAVEELPPAVFAGAYLQVGDDRYNRHEMKELYDSAEYPLRRKKSKRSA